MYLLKRNLDKFGVGSHFCQSSMYPFQYLHIKLLYPVTKIKLIAEDTESKLNFAIIAVASKHFKLHDLQKN